MLEVHYLGPHEFAIPETRVLPHRYGTLTHDTRYLSAQEAALWEMRVQDKRP